MFKSGKVAIIGRPNVGKSTLLNTLANEKVSIISEKPETTRDNIQGVISTKDYQIVFVDTPGLHKPKNMLGKTMVRKASSSILEVDLILVMIDCQKGMTRDDLNILGLLKDIKAKLFLIINKIDKINKLHILPMIENAKQYNFAEIIPISATKKNGTDRIVTKILEYLPEGFPIFPEDQLSDKNHSFMVREIIREKTLELAYQEVPHSIAVNIEEFQEKKDKLNNDLIYIKAIIYVERESQKSIIIGKDGLFLKKIGENSRKDIESILGKKVFLDLWVKVLENWRKDPFKLKKLGYID
jgi:GTP-binding protein Era